MAFPETLPVVYLILETGKTRDRDSSFLERHAHLDTVRRRQVEVESSGVACRLQADATVVATGHSSDLIYAALRDSGVPFTPSRATTTTLGPFLERARVERKSAARKRSCKKKKKKKKSGCPRGSSFLVPFSFLSIFLSLSRPLCLVVVRHSRAPASAFRKHDRDTLVRVATRSDQHEMHETLSCLTPR